MSWTRSLSFVLAAAVAAPALADELHRQNPINHFSGLSSQDSRRPGIGWMYETVADFDAQASWTVTDIEFWGGYPRVQPGNTQGFMIRFYEDADGAVGPLILTQDVMTFTEQQYYVWPPPLNFPGYHYTLTLNTPFSPPGAGRFWMGVSAILDYGLPDSVQWGWVQAQSIVGPPCQQSLNPPGHYNSEDHDVAFVLNGSAGGPTCGSADFNHDGDSATDLDIEDFFRCIAGNCCASCDSADFNYDGDSATDADIEAFFRVLAGGAC